MWQQTTETGQTVALVQTLVLGVVIFVLWNLYKRWTRKTSAKKENSKAAKVAENEGDTVNWFFWWKEKKKDPDSANWFYWWKEKKKDPSPEWGTAPTLQTSTPLAAEVGLDQQPSILWFVEVLQVVAVIIANAVKDAERAEESTLAERLEEAQKSLEASIQYHRDKKVRETIGERPFEIKEKPSRIETFEALDRKIKGLLREAQSKKYETIPTPETFKGTTMLTAPPHPLEEYEALFTLIPLPEIAQTFQTDETFAMVRVAGPNPMSIEGVSAAALADLVGHRITDDDFNLIMGTSGDSLEQAGAQGRLCVVNYRILTRTNPNVRLGRTFVTNPIAVFAEPLSGSDFIRPVAIQLGQDRRNSELILANTSDTFRWQIAKQIVQVADMVYHELVAHLAFTHLVMEAFSVATQRNLSKDHALYKLLMPHFEGTNFINGLAGSFLIAPEGPIDHIFASNPTRLKTLQQLAVGARSTFDFTNRMPDIELFSRNIERLKVFPYRDDAILIWNTIMQWAADYIDLYYDSDQAVKNDQELAAWSMDIETNGDLVNFREPLTKADLTRTLAMIIFTSSAQHAAVNFPQGTFMTYAPAFTGLIWDNIPDSTVPATEEDWLKTLPPVPVAQEQLAYLHLLGSVYHGRLGEYRSNRFPYIGTLDPIAEEALQKFNDSLEQIEAEINKRNETRGPFKYELLLPSWIPSSINI